jgi:hypothetical protein
VRLFTGDRLRYAAHFAPEPQVPETLKPSEVPKPPNQKDAQNFENGLLKHDKRKAPNQPKMRFDGIIKPFSEKDAGFRFREI